MSVAINLLPDARLAKLRAQHLRRLVTSLSILIWIIVAGVVVLLLAGIGAQKLQLGSLDSQIASKTSQIQSTPHLNDALTAQMALKTLPGLYSQRSGFGAFLPLLMARIPVDVHLTSVSDDATNTLTISGTAASAVSVDHYYEAIKTAGASSATGNFFSNVAINDVSKDGTGKASFSMTATVLPGVFNAAQ